MQFGQRVNALTKKPTLTYTNVGFLSCNTIKLYYKIESAMINNKILGLYRSRFSISDANIQLTVGTRFNAIGYSYSFGNISPRYLTGSYGSINIDLFTEATDNPNDPGTIGFDKSGNCPTETLLIVRLDTQEVRYAKDIHATWATAEYNEGHLFTSADVGKTIPFYMEFI